MNFITIISDTLRRDFLKPYGNDRVDTRNIQRFAEKSVVFDNAYSASFPTVPNRRDVFTGCYTATYTPWAPMTMFEPVLQVMLGQHGYTSMMITDQPHIVENGYFFDRGFDGWEWIRGQEHDRWKTAPRAPPFKEDPALYRNPPGLQKMHMRVRAQRKYEKDTFPGRTATCACEWLEDNYKESKPFYLYVDFFDPHEPWDPPQYFVDKYDPGYDGRSVDYPLYNKTAGYLTEREVQHCRALYAGEVTLVDRWVGRIFEKVEDLGLLEDTMIIFTTDHGFLLGEHGFIGKSFTNYQGEGKTVLKYIPLFEEINHIPLIVYHPDVKPGRRKAVVQPPDFFPTILDVADKFVIPSHGTSFKDVLLGKKPDHHRDFALSFPFLKMSGIPVSFVKGDWSAVFISKSIGKEQAGKQVIDKAVDGLEKTLEPWEEARDMLFNLKDDPRQLNDVSKDRPDLMATFKKEMVEYLDELEADQDVLNGWRDG